MKVCIKYSLAAVCGLMAIVLAYLMWNYYMLGPWTRDGKIRVEIIQISARVSGELIRLHIADNQLVKKGDPLLEIDPTDYVIAVTNAEAQLESLVAQLTLSERQFTRRKSLFDEKAISQESMDVAQAGVDSLRNQVKQAQAALEKARVDLNRTRIHAEVDGYVTNLNLRVGNMIVVNQPLFALVDKNSYYAVGYFEETKMPHVKVGRRVRVKPYDGSPELFGRITGYGRAIADQSVSTGSQMVSVVQPNYPWVALAQRVPVRIAFDQDSGGDRDLIAGSTCTITIMGE